MIDYEKLKIRFESLESLVNDLTWRMNAVCNELSLRDKAVTENSCDNVDTQCEHQSNGLSYMSNPPQHKCMKCGEFFRRVLE